MKTTITVIKADIGSIGGHITPSKEVINEVEKYVKNSNLITDSRILHTGDDIAILMAHQKGVDNQEIHKLAWDAFKAATEIAKNQGLYGAGQDLLKDAFSGNVKGLGPAVAEMEFEERPTESVIVFMADKTDPGAYNLPFYLGFCDPFYNSGLLLSPKIAQGYKFEIIDVNKVEQDRIIELSSPEEIYDIAVLLRDQERYCISSIYSRATGEKCAAVSTTRLHNIAGKYVGKDDPVAIVRTQKDFPATGEIIAPFTICHYVAGFMRGSHVGPLMPVKLNSNVSYFDGPPIVSGAAFCMRNSIFTELVDLFDHPFWDTIRQKASEKIIHIREQGFFGPAMLDMDELEYNEGIVERLKKLEEKFKLR